MTPVGGRVYRDLMLRRTAKGWAETPPATCPTGHKLLPGSHTVGVQICGGHHNGNHRAYYCHECQQTSYVPALGSACRVLHGAAGIRNL